MWLMVVALALPLSACGGDEPTAAPSTPTAPSAPATPVPSNDWALSGHLLAYASGAPVSGAHLTSPDLGPSDTDAQGGFRFSGTTTPAKTQARVTIEAPGYVTRESTVTWQRGSRDITLDLIPLKAPFSLDFYRQLVRNAFEAPTRLEPLRRLTASPRFYVRTVDEAGKPIEPEVLALVVATLPRAVRTFSAGRLDAAQVDQGTESRPRTSGWINVIFQRDPKSELCGQAFVGADAGQITLWDDTCNCGSVKIPGEVTLHEVGHAMGFWHVPDRGSVMYPQANVGCPNGVLSQAEQFHSALAYSRSPGNLDPDSEPAGVLYARPDDAANPPEVSCPAHR